MKLVFTKFVNCVPLEQCHHKPIGMYSGDILREEMRVNCSVVQVLANYHHTFPWVCGGSTPMAQGLYAWWRWASQSPVVALTPWVLCWHIRICHYVATPLSAVLTYTYISWYYLWENLHKIGSRKDFLMNFFLFAFCFAKLKGTHWRANRKHCNNISY